RQTRAAERERHYLVVVAVNDQGGHVELPQVVEEVCLGERLHALVGGGHAALHAEMPEVVEDSLRHLRAGSVGAVEAEAEVLPELRAVLEQRGADLVEDLER